MAIGYQNRNVDMWKTFVKAVDFHFRFLETEFGFVHKAIKPPFVIYESNALQVLVYYDDDRQGELDLGIRRREDDPRKVPSVGIGMLMRLRDGQDSKGYPSPFPSTPEMLEAEIKRLAELLKHYGSSILTGDSNDFERMAEIEKAHAEKFDSP